MDITDNDLRAADGFGPAPYILYTKAGDAVATIAEPNVAPVLIVLTNEVGETFKFNRDAGLVPVDETVDSLNLLYVDYIKDYEYHDSQDVAGIYYEPTEGG